MSDNGLFDSAISHLTNRLNSRGEGSEREELRLAIRFLEAAGKIEKESTLAWIKKKAAAIAPNNMFYEPKTWLICKHLIAFLETLPEKED